MWNETPAIIRPELGPQEQLLWSGQPQQGIVFRANDALMIPFSLLWGGFAVFWESMAIKSGQLFMMLWGIPFVLVGMNMIFGRFFVAAWQRKRMYYGVTNERIIIVSNFLSRKVKSLNLTTLAALTLDQGSDNSGTISFGGESKVAANWFSGAAWSGRRGQTEEPTFEGIQEAKKVYEIIREAQLQAQNDASAQLRNIVNQHREPQRP